MLTTCQSRFCYGGGGDVGRGACGGGGRGGGGGSGIKIPPLYRITSLF